MYNTIEEKQAALTNNILSQAKYFLHEAGEFYPFGAAINMQQQLRPVSFFTGEEFPEAGEVLRLLEESLNKGITEKEYSMAAIGVDVNITNGSETSKKSAVQVRILDADGVTASEYIYELRNGEYIFID